MGAIDDVKKQWDRLTPGEQQYLLDHPMDALTIRKSKEVAFQATQDQFGRNGHNDATDAFRHCYWSGWLAMNIGAAAAKEFTTAHESDPANPPDEKRMDLHNNGVGIWHGQIPGTTETSLKQRCYQALITGQLIVDPANPMPSVPPRPRGRGKP